MRLSLALLGAAQALTASAAPQAFASNENGNLKFSPVTAPVTGRGNPGSAQLWDLTIDDTLSGHKQKITGFGGAVTDATVAAYNLLPADKKAELLRKLMTGEGANFSLMRHTIASSDLSAAPEYTYDDNNGQPDPNFNSFNLGDRGRLMASLLREMKSVQPAMQLVGSSWSPPAWMQLDRRLVGGTVDNNLNHQYESQFGQYFARYLQAYRNEGVNVDAITIQNEPLNSNGGMPSLYIFADESGNLIRDHVGPAIRNAGFNTQIWAYDHNTDHPEYPAKVLELAGNFVNTVAWHCYAPGENWSKLTQFHFDHPGVTQYQTECFTSQTGATKWNQASWFTVGPLQNWAQGSIAWTLGTDSNNGPHLPYGGSCDVCTGLFTVNPSSRTYELRRDFYLLGQYSRYMPRGATVLAGTGSWTFNEQEGVESVATLNPDGTRTVAIENKYNHDVYVTVTTKSGQTWSGPLSPHSVTTWLLPAV